MRGRCTRLGVVLEDQKQATVPGEDCSRRAWAQGSGCARGQGDQTPVHALPRTPRRPPQVTSPSRLQFHTWSHGIPGTAVLGKLEPGKVTAPRKPIFSDGKDTIWSKCQCGFCREEGGLRGRCQDSRRAQLHPGSYVGPGFWFPHPSGEKSAHSFHRSELPSGRKRVSSPNLPGKGR